MKINLNKLTPDELDAPTKPEKIKSTKNPDEAQRKRKLDKKRRDVERWSRRHKH